MVSMIGRNCNNPRLVSSSSSSSSSSVGAVVTIIIAISSLIISSSSSNNYSAMVSAFARYTVTISPRFTAALVLREQVRRQSTFNFLSQRRRQQLPLSLTSSSSTFSPQSTSISAALWMKTESLSSQSNWDEDEIIEEEIIIDGINTTSSLPTTTKSTTAASSNKKQASKSPTTMKDRYYRSRLLFLNEEITRLLGNSGQKDDFNPNSPAQRSMAIFGEVRSCTKQILKEISSPSVVFATNNDDDDNDEQSLPSSTSAAEFNGISDDKRLLAEYILEYLDLLKLQQQQIVEQDEFQEKDTPTVISNPNQNRESTARTATAPIRNFSSEGGREAEDGRRQRRQKRKLRQRPITHEEVIDGLFAKKSCKLDIYWEEPLLELTRPVARDLAKQLDTTICPMGYDPDNGTKKGGGPTTRGKRVGFLGYCRDQKELYPEHVILVRCGDFYETFGVDAMLLVEHVGLNPMAGKARSGCPKQNIQATLDGLTQQGFSVAVYEEIAPVGTNNGSTTTSKLKQRSLAQIVSPASPTYLYDNWLLGGGDDAAGAGRTDSLPPPRPCVGVVHMAAGYNIIEISLEERSVQYSERLTSEAVACRLAAYPSADPLVYIPSHSEQERSRSGTTPTPSFLPKRGSSKGTGGHRLRTQILDPHLIPEASSGRSEKDRYIHAVVDTFLKMNELQTSDDEANSRSNLENRTSVSDFTVTMASTSTNPLYAETATQIGLMDDKTIPSLIEHVLDDAAPAATRRFLHRYLLIPPPPSVAQSMACVVKTLIDKDNDISLPPLTVPNLGKALILIRAGQAGANVYGELLQSLDTTMYILDMYDSDDDEEDSEITQLFVDALLNIAQHESGLPATRESLLERCREAVAAIEAVVSSSYHVDDDYDKIESSLDVISDDEYIPIEFFERNERTWRGRVQQDVAENAYRRVRDAAQKLRQAVKEDFIGSSDSNKSLLKYNFFDNLIGLNKIPGEGFEDEISFIHPSDRFGKVILNRWSTEKVKQAVACYVTECENATAEVSSILSALAQNLQDEGHIPAIVQSSHLNLILSTAFHHAVKATNSKWELANTIEDSSLPPASSLNNEKHQQIDGPQSSSAEAHFVDVFPYWMHRSKAVSNTFDLTSMILLTAPNMSGKSTLMRSTAAAALLTVCGLCGPLSSESRISRFDTLFLRGASADIPTEDKSAFGAEMGDLAALFRCSGPKSFVFVDELGRGTSPRDGTRLAGAVLERMADLGMSGIFATHLHDVLDLPLRKTRIVTKRIKIVHDEKDGSYEWTHKLEDGICTDSMALVTAERFGLPEEIIRRAEELTQFIPERTNTTVKDSIGSLVVGPMDDEENSFTSDGIIDDVFISSIPEISSSSTTESQLLEREQEKEHRRKEFLDVIDLASKLINDKTSSTPVQVPSRHHPPASLSNRSCLYVLQLTAPSSSSSSSSTTSRYYIGETDSLSKRLSQHRRKGSGMWSHSKAVVFPVDDKTQARYLESTLIGELARAGYSLESIADGRTLRHFRD